MIGYAPFAEREKICFKFIDSDKKVTIPVTFFVVYGINDGIKFMYLTIIVKL